MMAKKENKPVALIPPDLDRCQGEHSNGVNFMTLGGRREMIRCSNKPTHIAVELKPGAEMPKFDIGPDQLHDLVAYLESLK